jgi:hypothetical protein
MEVPPKDKTVVRKSIFESALRVYRRLQKNEKKSGYATGRIVSSIASFTSLLPDVVLIRRRVVQIVSGTMTHSTASSPTM